MLFLSPIVGNITPEDEGLSPDLTAKKLSTKKQEMEASEREIRKELVKLEKAMAALAQSAVSHNYIQGSSVAIYYKQNLVFEVNEVFKNSTPLSLASVTKPFTSMAIIQLSDSGMLKLTDPIEKYIPEYAKQFPPIEGKPITVRHLLNHTSGIPYIGARQIYAAGAKFMYSNYNYRLLANIIEKVSGQSYATYIRENIFFPLDMDDSMVSSNADGASGIAVSARDLANFASVYLRDGKYKDQSIIQSSKIKKIFKAPDFMPKTSNMEYYGLGWRVTRENNLVKMFYHTGLWNGIFADLRVMPQTKSFIIQLCNPPSYKAAGFSSYQGQMNALATKYLELLDKLPMQPETELATVSFLEDQEDLFPDAD
ncbi:MAG TPA: serine hydrolase domain-containing protein [Leptospiraceae bacterium]|nr:serine hydrolase domain-containing protein [Leptospiraceae bacterium]HMX30921.1 serine hydrolase domain-containing protein [Leptospiraceae bacterium]HMY30025.1 serine hydrolase domain-containing protein [Leptospiraceae bacterium]HMZ62788.1 serine hydrolase domain-containing protein [Leptospiraceae bacterium]HNA07333.1 serine hydrolase domain-containing protein [Leptospiraceae bacterium]